MDDRKHFFEDVCIPRNEFIKEHVKLLHLLRRGNRTQLLAEAKDQEGELKSKTGGSRAAGYIKKLIAMYKDGLEVFDINKMKWASDNLKAFGISMEEEEPKKRPLLKSSFLKKPLPPPAEAEKPAEAVNIIEQVTEDAEEKDVGKFSYNMDFFGAIDKMYTIQRNRASVRGKVVDAKLFDSIVSIQNNYDLYPTPLKSLLPIFEDIVQLEGRYTTPLSFLEPSAGTGNIVRSIIDFGNVKKIKQIDAVEMSQNLANLLQEQTSISNVYRQDFLTFEPKTDYHYIIMNPPYSDGNNKTFWLEHMMKAMSIAWNQTKDGGGLQCAIYIIIPTTYLEPMFKEYYPNGYGAAKKYIGEEIQFDMKLCNKKKDLVKKYGFYDNETDDWDADFWLKKVGIVDDFAKIERNGTARPLNITTGIYRLMEGQMGGKKKKRSTHYNPN